MAKTINAIYENGVFKPLEPISLKEHERVTLDINLEEQLRKQLKELTEGIYKRIGSLLKKENLTYAKQKSRAKNSPPKKTINARLKIFSIVTSFRKKI